MSRLMKAALFTGILAFSLTLGWMLGACTDEISDQATVESAEQSAGADPVVIDEAYMTSRDTTEDIDSPATWHGADGQHWLLATAKTGDRVWIYDAATGESIQSVGVEGSGSGQMNRPNGIAVFDDLMFVVERDNARIQVISLPGLESVGFVGDGLLVRPYGIAGFSPSPGVFELYVTDNYETADEEIPPDSELGRRVHHYRVSIGQAGVESSLVKAFGDTTGAGVLRKVESIAVDPERGVLLIAEELEGQSEFREYSLDGRYREKSLGEGRFPGEAEGIVLYACDGGEGYWIATDQSHTTNTFHVFDRKSYDWLASFTGSEIRNTDGIALTQTAFGPFSAGAFFAVHDDGGVGAIDWQTIADATGLRADCVN